MKSKQNPYAPLNRSLHFWAFHTGYSVPTLSRKLKQLGYRVSKSKASPGVTLNKVLSAIDYRDPRYVWR